MKKQNGVVEGFSALLIFAIMTLFTMGVMALLIEFNILPWAGEPAGDPALSANQVLQDGKPFRFISPNRQHPVVRTMALGFWEACEFYKVDCVDNSFDGVDMANFAAAADVAIAQGTSGAIPFVDKVVYESDKKIIAAGIPSVAIHTTVPEGEVPGLMAWVAADATDYAIRAAVTLGDKLGGKGTVAITQGSLNDVENAVSLAFTKTMNEKYPGITVLAPEMEGFDPPQAIALCVTILQAHPEVTGAFGTTGGSPTAWAKAAEQVGKAPGEVAIIGMDYTRENLDLVKSGQVYALVGQPLYEELYRAVELLVDNLNEKPVAYGNVYPAPIITIETIDTYYGYADRVDAGINK